MDLLDHVSTITNFDNLNHVEKVKYFAWYLTTHGNKPTFTTRELGICFESVSAEKPSSVSPFLASLANRKPPVLLRRSNGFVLERRALRELDDRYGQREITIQIHRLLAELPSKVHQNAERAYLEEALVCFRHGAFRASIVMTWNLAYDHLCQVVLSSHLVAFNNQLPKSFPKSKVSAVVKRDDFGDLKESDVIQVCKSAGIISGSIHKILKEKLDRRNIAAHPSAVSISQLTAEEYIRDLIENVVLRPI